MTSALNALANVLNYSDEEQGLNHLVVSIEKVHMSQ